MTPDSCASCGEEPTLRDTTQEAIEHYVLAVILPLWIASGSIDYVLHRRSHIEATSGTFESVLHVAGISLSAIPVVAGLVLEVNAGVLRLMSLGYTAHAGMTLWDVAYANGRREITTTEQHVHGMLEILPFAALSFMLVAHRAQALALAGRSNVTPCFALHRKRNPIPGTAFAALGGAFLTFVALPYVEELSRCLRYERP